MPRCQYPNWHKYKVRWEVHGGFQTGKPYVLPCIKRPHVMLYWGPEYVAAGMEKGGTAFYCTSTDRIGWITFNAVPSKEHLTFNSSLQLGFVMMGIH